MQNVHLQLLQQILHIHTVDGNITPSLVAGGFSDSKCSISSTDVTFHATDSAFNIATCSFTITVVDDEDPVITGCPSDIITGTDLGLNYSTPTWNTIIANDNDVIQSFTSTHASGDEFDLGVTYVTYIATDVSENINTCQFPASVNNEELPVWSNCPYS
jgi:hypothetical protein